VTPSARVRSQASLSLLPERAVHPTDPAASAGTEHEGYAALNQIDRLLNAPNIYDQAAGAAKLPTVFASFPFPTIVNAAALKAAEAFKTKHVALSCIRPLPCGGQLVSSVLTAYSRRPLRRSNGTRYFLLQAFRQSVAALESSLSTHEQFGMRITHVLESNDVIARALALR
jgi:hypothetical protein